MRLARVIVLAAACAACSGPSGGTQASDASVETAPPAPFVPYDPRVDNSTAPPMGGPGAAATSGAGTAGIGPPPPGTAGFGSAGAGGMAAGPGTGGMAGPGFAGMGAAGQGGPPPDAGGPTNFFCAFQPNRPLPYDLSNEFTGRLVLQPSVLTVIDNPSCNQLTFPDAAPSPPGVGVDATAPPATASTCSAFKYRPDGCAGPCWAAVFFTPPGTQVNGQGICIQPGATAIRFKARASKNNARVKFGAVREGVGSTEFFFNLTQQWRSYTLMVPLSADYDSSGTPGGVWNGFSVVVEPQDHGGGTYILVADVIWDR